MSFGNYKNLFESIVLTGAVVISACDEVQEKLKIVVNQVGESTNMDFVIKTWDLEWAIKTRLMEYVFLSDKSRISWEETINIAESYTKMAKEYIKKDLDFYFAESKMDFESRKEFIFGGDDKKYPEVFEFENNNENSFDVTEPEMEVFWKNLLDGKNIYWGPISAEKNPKFDYIYKNMVPVIKWQPVRSFSLAEIDNISQEILTDLYKKIDWEKVKEYIDKNNQTKKDERLAFLKYVVENDLLDSRTLMAIFATENMSWNGEDGVDLMELMFGSGFENLYPLAMSDKASVGVSGGPAQFTKFTLGDWTKKWSANEYYEMFNSDLNLPELGDLKWISANSYITAILVFGNLAKAISALDSTQFERIEPKREVEIPSDDWIPELEVVVSDFQELSREDQKLFLAMLVGWCHHTLWDVFRTFQNTCDGWDLMKFYEYSETTSIRKYIEKYKSFYESLNEERINNPKFVFEKFDVNYIDDVNKILDSKYTILGSNWETRFYSNNLIYFEVWVRNWQTISWMSNDFNNHISELINSKKIGWDDFYYKDKNGKRNKCGKNYKVGEGEVLQVRVSINNSLNMVKNTKDSLLGNLNHEIFPSEDASIAIVRFFSV